MAGLADDLGDRVRIMAGFIVGVLVGFMVTLTVGLTVGLLVGLAAALQAPLYATFTFKQCAMHLLLYVLPFLPQTGTYPLGHLQVVPL